MIRLLYRRYQYHEHTLQLLMAYPPHLPGSVTRIRPPVCREQIDWLQASGLTIAAAGAEHDVSVASVYHSSRVQAESEVSGWRLFRRLFRVPFMAQMG